MDRDRRPHRDVEQARQDESSAESPAGVTAIRLKLGLEDVKTKRFLNHLTRFHYLKRRLDRKAKELLSGALNHERYATRRTATPLQQEGEADIAWQRAAAARAQTPLKAIIKSAVQAAGLEPESQPNLFMECGDGFYTAATLGPLKKEARCVEKAAAMAATSAPDDIAQEHVVDNEAQLRAASTRSSPRVMSCASKWVREPVVQRVWDGVQRPRGWPHRGVQVHLTPFLSKRGRRTSTTSSSAKPTDPRTL